MSGNRMPGMDKGIRGGSKVDYCTGDCLPGPTHAKCVMDCMDPGSGKEKKPGPFAYAEPPLGCGKGEDINPNTGMPCPRYPYGTKYSNNRSLSCIKYCESEGVTYCCEGAGVGELYQGPKDITPNLQTKCGPRQILVNGVCAEATDPNRQVPRTDLGMI